MNNIEDIIKIIGNDIKKDYGVDILKKSRRADIVMLRRALISFLYYNMDYNKSRIGEAIGFDHSTVIHNLQQSENLLSVKDREYMRAYQYVKMLLIKYDLLKIKTANDEEFIKDVFLSYYRSIKNLIENIKKRGENLRDYKEMFIVNQKIVDDIERI